MAIEFLVVKCEVLLETKQVKKIIQHVEGSPGDLHGMWYPPVRRTLVCLSRLYRCIERPIFQGLSQEALTMCIQSINSAAETIKANKVSYSLQLIRFRPFVNNYNKLYLKLTSQFSQ